MQKIILTSFSIVITMAFSFGQTEEATTKSGKKIIISLDGTWKYADEKISSSFNYEDCLNFIKITEDKMTGDKMATSKNRIIVSQDGGKTGLGIVLMTPSKGVLILNILASGAGNCIDKGGKVNILFTDGSKLELTTNGDFNCKGEATIYLGGVAGKKKQFEELKTKKIQAIRVWTDDGYVERDFTEDNSNMFYQTINCLTRE